MKQTCLLLLLCAALCILAGVAGADEGVFITPVDGLSESFCFAADVSSVLALEKAGVVYYDADGTPADLFELLKRGGFTAVRVRVWNDPYDEHGNGYGGGNCDVDAACSIGARAAQAGLSLIVDFHYSDFWADPKKQMCPKAWQSMAIAEKVIALHDFTADALTKIQASGARVTLVQIGNETDSALAGETNKLNISKLLNAGSAAVRETLPDALVAVHFSKPDIMHAQNMRMFMVDYDVFGVSYYPFWHGSLENLTTVLSAARDTYGKQTMVMETSYCYTLENLDTHANSIPASGITLSWATSVQGQANAMRAVVQAAHDGGALGISYWEPAWLPVPGDTFEAQSALWEACGAGWASSFSKEFDPDDAGQWYGGSSWDNQALFDADGRALPTLRFPLYLRTGASAVRAVDSYENVVLSLFVDDGVSLPQTVNAIYNDGSTEAVPVVWDPEQTAAMLDAGLGDFVIDGTADGHAVTCALSVTAENFLTNGDFEHKDMSAWTLQKTKGAELGRRDSVNDAKSGTGLLHYYDEKNVAFKAEQTLSDLRPGSYDFSLFIHGGSASTQEMYIYVLIDGVEFARASMGVTEWREWQRPEIQGIPVMEGQTVVVGAYVSCEGDGPWGKLDDWLLNLSR